VAPARDLQLREDSATILPWLYGVTLNVVRNRARSARRAAAALRRVEARTTESDFADDR
jgi:RNA polymerase sigma-70 factor, ECF subfamily